MSGGSRTYYPVASLPDTNARQPSMQIRPPSTSLLCIDSGDRNQGLAINRVTNTSPYTPIISKTESILNGFFTRLGVTEVVLPWVIPNINPKTSAITVSVTVNAGPITTRTLRLNPTFLRPSQLAAAMQGAVRLLFQDIPSMVGFTMIYGGLLSPSNAANDSNVPAFEYNTNAVNTLIAFTPMTPNSTAYPYPANTVQLFDLLGFNLNPVVGASVLQQTYTGGFTYCSPIRYVDIVCNQLTYNQALKDSMSQPVVRDTLCRVYLNVPGTTQSTISCADATFCPPGCAPTTIYRDFASPKRIQWLPNQPVPGYLSFQVLDDTGAPLDESDPFFVFESPEGASVTGSANKTDWSLTLQVTEN